MSSDIEDRDLDAELQDAMNNLLEYDQSLTDDERRAERAKERGDRFMDALKRMKKLLQHNAPKHCLALEARGIYRRACGLWTDQMNSILANELTEESRRRQHQCVICGKDLPLPVRSENCKECEANLDEMTA